MARTSDTNWASPASGSPPHKVTYKIGIYGWRKRCLYCLILVMFVAMMLNLALTIWLLTVLDFNLSGMGSLRITPEGIRVEGESVFVGGEVRASAITSRDSEPLRIQADTNITLSAAPASSGSRVFIKDKLLKVTSKRFRFEDEDGSEVLSFEKDRMGVKVPELQVCEKCGASFSSSVQTRFLRSKSGAKLKLSSPTSSLQLEGVSGVSIKAAGGGVSASCSQDVTVTSKQGDIKLSGRRVKISQLPIMSAPENKMAAAGTAGGVLQLCACGGSGKLFAVLSDSLCEAESGFCEDD